MSVIDEKKVTGKLLTDKLIKRFAEVGDQDVADPIVVAKFFNPLGTGIWYATAYFPKTNCIFCYVTGLAYDEWGYSSIDELESVKCPPLNLPIERDLFFEEKMFSEIINV